MGCVQCPLVRLRVLHATLWPGYRIGDDDFLHEITVGFEAYRLPRFSGKWIKLSKREIFPFTNGYNTEMEYANDKICKLIGKFQCSFYFFWKFICVYERGWKRHTYTTSIRLEALFVNVVWSKERIWPNG